MIIRLGQSYFERPPLEWLLHHSRGGGPLRCFERYEPLRCSTCGKLPEMTAVRKYGIDETVHIDSDLDFLVTCDNMIVFSERLVELLPETVKSALWIVRLPGRSGRSLIFPTELAAVAYRHSGVRFLDLCPECLRFGQTVGGPRTQAISAPQNASLIWSVAMPDEDKNGHRVSLYTALQTAELLVANRVTGVTLSGQGTGASGDTMHFNAAGTACKLCGCSISTIADNISFNFHVDMRNPLREYADAANYHRACYWKWDGRDEFELLVGEELRLRKYRIAAVAGAPW